MQLFTVCSCLPDGLIILSLCVACVGGCVGGYMYAHMEVMSFRGCFPPSRLIRRQRLSCCLWAAYS